MRNLLEMHDDPAACMAVPATPRLLAAAGALRIVVRNRGTPAAVREVARRVGSEWVATLLDGVMVPIASAIRGHGAGRRTAVVLRARGRLIVEEVTSRAGVAQITSFLPYLDEHLDIFDGRAVLHAPMDEGHVALVAAALRVDGPDPAALRAALHATIYSAVRHFCHEPVRSLGIGTLDEPMVTGEERLIARLTERELDRGVTDPAAVLRLRNVLASLVLGVTGGAANSVEPV